MDQERVVGSAYWDLRHSRLISRGSGVGYTWPSSSSTTHETGFLISFFSHLQNGNDGSPHREAEFSGQTQGREEQWISHHSRFCWRSRLSCLIWLHVEVALTLYYSTAMCDDLNVNLCALIQSWVVTGSDD